VRGFPPAARHAGRDVVAAGYPAAGATRRHGAALLRGPRRPADRRRAGVRPSHRTGARLTSVGHAAGGLVAANHPTTGRPTMNLDDLDREVRDSLLAHAQEAPDGAGTLDAVRARSRRLRVRHRAGLAGIAAAVAVAVAVGAPYALTAARHTGSAANTAGARGGTTANVPTTNIPTITSTSPPAV